MDNRTLADAIGDNLRLAYPPNRALFVPAQHVEAIADEITAVVAEILQAWLDAGSERDVTFEELGPVILDHVKGWSDDPANAPHKGQVCN